MAKERWIAIPTLRTINEVRIYCWEGFEVRESRKGKSVFAKAFHSAGLMLPYGGIKLWFGAYIKLVNGDSRRISYMVNGR